MRVSLPNAVAVRHKLERTLYGTSACKDGKPAVRILLSSNRKARIKTLPP